MMGQHQSPATELKVEVPQGLLLGPPLFAVYCSPVANITADHWVQHHQYTDDTQLHLAMHDDNIANRLTVLATCAADIRWYIRWW